MNLDFENKKVLITGATRGIGFEIAKAFEKLNATVIITGTKDNFITKEFNYHYEKLFISKENDWKSEINSIINKYNGFDICINNAGINKINPIEKVFEPFFTYEKINGSGIGLFMSKLIIEKNMNGKLLAENSSKGAFFKIIIPKI